MVRSMITQFKLLQILLVILATQPFLGHDLPADELQHRIAFADKQFAAHSTRGSQTDRGKVYIALGPPDQIEDHTGTENPNHLPEFISYPWQEWKYRTIPGIGKDV